MRGRTTEEAVEQFLDHRRLGLSCIVRGAVIGTGRAVGPTYGVALFAGDNRGMRPIRLPTHGRNGELHFRLISRYRVVPFAGDDRRNRYEAREISYHYDVLDRDEREIVVFHWEPDGISTVRTPHLHVPAAPTVVLPQRLGSSVAGAKTDLGRLHLPTGYITIADIVEMLIREFQVVPLRSDWQAVVDSLRASR